jgi:hypothetical protein
VRTDAEARVADLAAENDVLRLALASKMTRVEVRAVCASASNPKPQTLNPQSNLSSNLQTPKPPNSQTPTLESKASKTPDPLNS